MEVKCSGDGWGGKLVLRGQTGMGIDSVCAVMDGGGDGLIFHYRAAVYFELV